MTTLNATSLYLQYNNELHWNIPHAPAVTSNSASTTAHHRTINDDRTASISSAYSLSKPDVQTCVHVQHIEEWQRHTQDIEGYPRRGCKVGVHVEGTTEYVTTLQTM